MTEETGYLVNVNGVLTDMCNNIFQRGTSGTVVNYKSRTSQKDLSQLFAGFIQGGTAAPTTGYKFNSLDLNTYFAKYIYKK